LGLWEGFGFEVFLGLGALEPQVLRLRGRAAPLRMTLLLGVGGLLLGVLVVFEVGGGDLEGVEEESGAARVEVVLGDAGDDLAEGLLDGGSAAGLGEGEGAAAGLAEAGVGNGAALGVVVVAELFSAHSGGATAASLGEGVAALVAAEGVVAVFDLLDELVHWSPTLGESM
jgi:hypothetical protein